MAQQGMCVTNLNGMLLGDQQKGNCAPLPLMGTAWAIVHQDANIDFTRKRYQLTFAQGVSLSWRVCWVKLTILVNIVSGYAPHPCHGRRTSPSPPKLGGMGKFPDYERVLPRGRRQDCSSQHRQVLRNAFVRTAISCPIEKVSRFYPL